MSQTGVTVDIKYSYIMHPEWLKKFKAMNAYYSQEDHEGLISAHQVLSETESLPNKWFNYSIVKLNVVTLFK